MIRASPGQNSTYINYMDGEKRSLARRSADPFLWWLAPKSRTIQRWWKPFFWWRDSTFQSRARQQLELIFKEIESQMELTGNRSSSRRLLEKALKLSLAEGSDWGAQFGRHKTSLYITGIGFVSSAIVTGALIWFEIARSLGNALSLQINIAACATVLFFLTFALLALSLVVRIQFTRHRNEKAIDLTASNIAAHFSRCSIKTLITRFDRGLWFDILKSGLGTIVIAWAFTAYFGNILRPTVPASSGTKSSQSASGHRPEQMHVDARRYTPSKRLGPPPTPSKAQSADWQHLPDVLLFVSGLCIISASGLIVTDRFVKADYVEILSLALDDE